MFDEEWVVLFEHVSGEGITPFVTFAPECYETSKTFEAQCIEQLKNHSWGEFVAIVWVEGSAAGRPFHANNTRFFEMLRRYAERVTFKVMFKFDDSTDPDFRKLWPPNEDIGIWRQYVTRNMDATASSALIADCVLSLASRVEFLERTCR